MSFRAWVFIATLGIAFASVANAQGSEEQPIDQNTEGQGQQPSEAKPTPPGFPIRILEEPEQSEGAKREQQEASQREIDDLQAQNLAAESAQGAYRVGIAQTALAFFGTLALIYSLYLNRRATNAAQEAVALTREMGERQIRAYLSITDMIGKNFVPGRVPEFSLNVTNGGQSPARECKVISGIFLSGRRGDEAKIFIPKPNPAASSSEVAVGKFISVERPLSAAITSEQIDAMRNGTAIFIFAGFGVYKDVFGKTRRFTFKLDTQILKPDATTVVFRFCGRGNKSS